VIEPETSTAIARRLLPAIVAAVLLLPVSSTAQTLPWPTRPVRIVVGWPPGGNVDVLSRILADEVGKRVSQPVVVDNRPGADGVIGVFRKLHNQFEWPVFGPGDHLSVFETRFGKVGMFICYDLAFPETVRASATTRVSKPNGTEIGS